MTSYDIACAGHGHAEACPILNALQEECTV
jgi:hypothetical protein